MKNPCRNVVTNTNEYPLIEHLLEQGIVMDVCELRAEITRMVSDLEKSRYDHLTGFLLRGPWYAGVKKAIIRKCPALKDLENAGAAEAIRLLRDAMKLLKHDDLSLMFGDVAMLNFANKAGERYGDVLIEIIADYIKKHFAFDSHECSLYGRLGGDEFAVLIEGQSIYSLRYNADIFERHLRERDIAVLLPHFAEHGVKARFNNGIATLEEACRLTADIIEYDVSGGKDPMELLLNTFVAIADGRMKISKGVSHITLVASLLQGTRKRYEVLKPYVLKGCIGISMLRLWQFMLMQMFFKKESFNKILLRYILRKMKKDAVKNLDDMLIVETVLDPWKD